MTGWIRGFVCVVVASSGARAFPAYARTEDERASARLAEASEARRRQSSVSPQQAVDELLAADRAFSAASAKTDLVAGLSAMFADDVVIPMPPGQFVNGRAAVVEALKGNADNATSRTDWTPVRGGVSADGQHGFTFGYMTIHRADQTHLPLK